jgi:uncharacterized protein HemX
MTDSSTQQAPESIHRNASWGALISITIILAMVIVGAFYSWGKRIRETQAVESQLQANPSVQTTTYQNK